MREACDRGVPTGAGSLVCDLGSGDWQTCPSRPRSAATRTCSVDSDYSQEAAGLHATTSHAGAPTLCWAQSVCILRSPLRQALLRPHMTAEQTVSDGGVAGGVGLEPCAPALPAWVRSSADSPGTSLASWFQALGASHGKRPQRHPSPPAPRALCPQNPVPTPLGRAVTCVGPVRGPRHLRSGQ